MVKMREDRNTDKFEPNGRIKVKRKNGDVLEIDVMITNNEKGEVYTSQQEVDDNSPSGWLEYSNEGGWAVDGYPEGAGGTEVADLS